MNLPIDFCLLTPNPEKDFRTADVCARKALDAHGPDEAKHFNQLSRFYWARSNS